MKDCNRVLSWKRIADIQYKQKVTAWKHKPKFRIGEVIVVKKTAQSIYGKESGGIWGNLIIEFDKHREPLISRQGVIVEIHHDRVYGCSYHVLFGNKKGNKKGRKVLMDEQWLRKREQMEVCEDFMADMIWEQVNEDGY